MAMPKLLLLLLGFIFLLLETYAVLVGPFIPSTGIYVLDVLAQDKHYKYFVVLIIPAGTYFVIANWVGWQYYRNS